MEKDVRSPGSPSSCCELSAAPVAVTRSPPLLRQAVLWFKRAVDVEPLAGLLGQAMDSWGPPDELLAETILRRHQRCLSKAALLGGSPWPEFCPLECGELRHRGPAAGCARLWVSCKMPIHTSMVHRRPWMMFVYQVPRPMPLAMISLMSSKL